jgi:DNA (cytosine-5)-methyltransferase 1
MAQNPIRAFDLFCGGGGSSIGAKQAGATPVGGVDQWPIATDAFSLNLPKTKTFTNDLLELDPYEVAKKIDSFKNLNSPPRSR